MYGSIDIAVRDEVDGCVITVARCQRNSDALIEINDRQPVLERNALDAFDVADVPQRPREQIGIRRLRNDGNRTGVGCGMIYLDM